jgi:hypothetical protein
MTPPRAISGYRGGLTALLLLVGGCLAFVFFRFNPVQHSFFPVCIFYRMTGLYCPGCGAQRALHALLHGELLTALHFNPLFIVALPFLAFWAGRSFLHLTTGVSPTPIVIRPFWIILLASVVIVFGIVRNIPCTPFTYLSPP